MSWHNIQKTFKEILLSLAQNASLHPMFANAKMETTIILWQLLFYTQLKILQTYYQLQHPQTTLQYY